MTDLQTPPMAAAEAPPESDGVGNRKLLWLLVGVVGVVVLGAAAYFLFLSGAETEEPLPPITRGTPSAEAQGENGNGNENGGGNTNQTVPAGVDEDLEVGQDPFEPLAVEAVEEPDAATTTDGATSVTDGNGTGGGNGGGDQAATYEVRIASVDVASRKATILVDGKSYTVKEGDVFPSATTGPFKAASIGRTGDGVAYVKVVYGSDLPVVMKKGSSAKFGG